MRKRIGKQVLCLLLALSVVIGFTPVTSFAGWEDGIECEFCGGYRFDDWVCDDGPHCSDSSDASDCYYENHCAECLGPVENSERCDICYVCPDCMNDSGTYLHCALCGACDEGGYDVCDNCDLCMNCQVEFGSHCFDCGDCMDSASQCPDHPFEMYQENHCEACALTCTGCENQCYLGEIYVENYCEEHELCVVCATDDGLHCKECYGCYEDELCSECQLCDECGLESGKHCPECDEHGADWCETGGEETHCVECASEYICEQCDVCTSCGEIEFCDECGLCVDCCRENAESENCSCGEYCIEGANWEEHFCADCGTCFDENEHCETCEYCVECCESQSECSDNMCVEDIEYDEHFCEQCQQCFHDVEACESCQDAGVSLCVECCAGLTEDQGCSHEYCTNGWQWDEHYCDLCGKCYGDVDCDHVAEAHVHTYDTNGNCTVCGYNKDGKPVITKQPKSVTANPGDTAAVYTVEAMGDDLTYQWYYINLSTGKPVAMTDGTAYQGTKTNTVSLTVQVGMCSLGKPVQIFCVVKNLNGNVTTDTVNFLVAHQYGKYQRDATHHWYACENCDKIKDQTEHRFNSWTILKQASQTESGLKRRICYDCNYANTVAIPALPSDHAHDYSAAFVTTDTFHWTKCACGNENKGAMEEHDFGDGDGWIITIQPTLISVGEKTRTCVTCGYVETREIEKQGHTHEFYNEEYLEKHKDNGNYGYILDEDGYRVNLYAEPYGKTNGTYHYAYCVVDGCDAYERYTHKWTTEWYDVPTETLDGSYERSCKDCFYTTGLKSLPAGKYRVITKNCTTNIQAAAPGATVKISLYKDYPAGYFINFNESAPNIDVNYTWGDGATNTWKMIEEEYHAPDEKNPKGYWTFTMPELPEGSNWMKFYVEVEAELIDCSEDNHGDGRGFAWTGAKEATCGQPGYTGDYKCKWCNYIEERGHDTPATGEHGELIAEADYLGDCNHAGYTGAKRCSVCDEIIVPREYHGKTHKVTKVEGTYIAATCTSKGQTSKYVCGRCGIVLTKSKSIAKRPHDWEHIEGTATCTTGGTLDHVRCKSCGQISIDGGATILRNIAKLNSGALGHIYDEGTVTKAATCVESGEKLYTCTGDGCSVTKRETIEKDANKHVGGTELVNVKTADHKAQTAGYTGDTKCLGCGVILSYGTSIAPTAHKAGTPWITDGTHHWKVCTVDGCGVVMDKTAHTPDHTGGATESYAIKCTGCGYIMEAQLNHTHVFNQSVATTTFLKSVADCDSRAVYYKSCKCGAKGTETFEYGEAVGHKEVTVAGKAATCTAAGLTDGKKCSVCGVITVEQKSIAAKGHSYGSDNVCDVCGHDKTEPHVCSLSLVKEKAPTCKEIGKKAYYQCDECGKYFEDAARAKEISNLAEWGVIAAKGHTEVTIAGKAATCTDTGLTDGKKCSVCGVITVEQKPIAAKDHIKSTKTTKATTTKNGKVVTTCKTCGKQISSKTIYKASTVKLSYKTATYSGKVKSPKITIKDSKGKVISSKNYTITKPTGRKNVDKYTYKIKLKNQYSGTKSLTLTINPKSTSVSKLVKGKKQITVKWKKVSKQATGYEIMYSTSKKFTKSTTKTTKVTSYKTTSKKLTRLKAKKTYYVKVRTYKTVNGKKYYSAWSKAKSIQTK